MSYEQQIFAGILLDCARCKIVGDTKCVAHCLYVRTQSGSSGQAKLLIIHIRIDSDECIM